jgi:hypothetical protein
MDLTRGVKAQRGLGLRVSWLVAAHWIALVVVPYLLFAAWAGALDDPEAWLTHRCWGRPHVVWLGLGNAGLLAWLGLEVALRRDASVAWRAGAAVFLGVLAVAQIALWRWEDALRLLIGA